MRCILSPIHAIILLLALLLMVSFALLTRPAHSMNIDPDNVHALAIYGDDLNFGIDLAREDINFNITSEEMIHFLISFIDFTTTRDCSDIGTDINAYLYLKFRDSSIEVYNIFDTWSHLCKLGLYGECYNISIDGQLFLEDHKQ